MKEPMRAKNISSKPVNGFGNLQDPREILASVI
jgi:hypothetical protein